MVLLREVYGGSAVTEIGDSGVDEFAAAVADLDGSTITIDVEIEYVRVGGLTPAASLIFGVIRQVYGSGFAMSQGPVVRHIAQSSSWSQHAYGNAIDIMVTGDLHHDIAYFLDANRGALAVAHLLADPYFPSPLGDHYGHVHVDPYPQWGGTPPGHPI
jgi:hypothetical protein